MRRPCYTKERAEINQLAKPLAGKGRPGTEPGGVCLAWPTLVNTRGEGTGADSGNGERINPCRDMVWRQFPGPNMGYAAARQCCGEAHMRSCPPGLKAEMLPCDGAEAAAQQTVRAENID